MWLPKRFRKQPQDPVEHVIHVRRYVLSNPADESTVVLTLHLPSKRVSESFYDETGMLKRYVQISPIADQHITNLCTLDDKLDEAIKKSQKNYTQMITEHEHENAAWKKLNKRVWTIILICGLLILEAIIYGYRNS